MHKEEDNIYFIKQELSKLRRWGSAFEAYYIDHKFVVKIFCPLDEYGVRSLSRLSHDHITQYEKIDVNVYDLFKDGSESYINLDTDPRFKDYTPIQHPTNFAGNPVVIRTGIGMPIINLCELIKYLHRLSKISAFC